VIFLDGIIVLLLVMYSSF